MIQIQMTTEQFAAKAAQLKQEQGIDLSGTEGTITKGTPLGHVEANYLYHDGTLSVTVTKHPFTFSTGKCEDEIHAWLAGS